MKKIIKTMFFTSMVVVSCSKEEKTSPVSSAESSKTLFNTRTSVSLSSRISDTQTATLTLTKNPQTGHVTVSKSITTAHPSDVYTIYCSEVSSTNTTNGVDITIPRTGSYYFIPFDDTQNAMAIGGGTVIGFSCECCSTSEVGGGCRVSALIQGMYITLSCQNNGCTGTEGCGLIWATGGQKNRTGVYLPATGITITQ